MKEESDRNYEPLYNLLKTHGLTDLVNCELDEIINCVKSIERPTPVVQAKTAEEIMQDFDLINEDGDIEASFKQVRDCINAYHAQFTPAAKSVEVEEAAEAWADKMNPVSRGSDSWANDKESFLKGYNSKAERHPILSEFSFQRFKVTGINDNAIRELSVDDINNLNNIIPCIGVKMPTEHKLLMMPDGQTCHEDYLIFEPYSNWQQQKQSDTISRLREALEQIVDKVKYKEDWFYNKPSLPSEIEYMYLIAKEALKEKES